jgi:CheY-like chemotaxis protein
VPYTLLLADDSVTIQRVIELTFADEDVTVIAVSDGDQAIERLESAPPDIVLADIGMPGKNGYEVAQHIRRSSRLAHIPVVLLTGAFEPVDQARVDQAGCDGVLAKPFEPQLVIGRVKELLARAQRLADASVAISPTAGAANSTAPPPGPPAAPDARYSWASPPAEQQPEPSQAETDTHPAPQSELNDYFDRLDVAFSTLSSTAPAPPPIIPVPEAPPTVPGTDFDWFSSGPEEAGAATSWDFPANAEQPADVSSPDMPLSNESSLPQAAVAPSPEPETFAAVTAIEPTPEDPAVDAAEWLIDTNPIVEPAAVVWTESTVEVKPMAEAEPAAETAPMVEASAIAPPDERLAPIEESAPIEQFAFVADAVAPPPPAVAAPPALALPLPSPPPLPALSDAFAALLAAEQGQPLSPDAGLWPAAATLPTPPPAAIGEELIEEVTRRVLDRLSDTVVREAVAGVASKIAEGLIREEIQRIKASIK